MPAQTPRLPVIIAIGIVAGFLSGLFGIGGGVIMVPLLVLAARFPQREASATSLAAIIPTATVAAVAYVSSGTVPIDQLAFGVVIATGAAALASVGARALRTWNVRVVRWVFISLLAVTSVMIFVTIPERSAHLDWSVTSVVELVAIGALMGFTAGLLGVGGGILAVPILILMGVSDLTAKALSLVAMVPAAITGTATSHRAGLVQWRTVLPLAITTTCAAPFGVWASTSLPETWANPLLAAIIVYAAVQLADRAIREARRS
ncbi:MAG: sulfite exporter TauE/SafE family protein [Microbacteriaceae bacterium]